MEPHRERTRLVAARAAAGLSQEEVAERIGVTRNTVSQWERGVSYPYPVHVHALCQLFDTSLHELGLAPHRPKQEPNEPGARIRPDALIPHTLPIGAATLLNKQAHPTADFSYGMTESLLGKDPHASPQAGSKRDDSFTVIDQLSHDEFTLARTSLSMPSLFQADLDILTRLSAVLSKPSLVGEKEITYFDRQTRLYWGAREETALPATTLYAYVIRHTDDITALLARSHLPMLRSYLCETICRTVLLAGILLYDMGQYIKARQHYQVAFQAATEANNSVLQAIVWGWVSFTWTYAQHYTEALSCIQHACYFAKQTRDNITQAWLGAVEAEIQAQLGNCDACLQALSDTDRVIDTSPSQDTSYLFEFNPVLLLGYKGVCLQQFYRRQEPATHRLLEEAKEALEQALASEAPTKRKLYYLSDLAGVYARQGEVERACAYVVQCLPLIMQVGSGSKTIRKHLLQVRTLLQPHQQTSSVQALDEQMAPLLLEMQTE